MYLFLEYALILNLIPAATFKEVGATNTGKVDKCSETQGVFHRLIWNRYTVMTGYKRMILKESVGYKQGWDEANQFVNNCVDK